ncbi:MAG: AraC family ligand binding domain-containing protein [Flavonifractor plautii]
MTIAGETLRLAPGELVFFQPGEPHACRPVGGASGLAGAPRAAGGHGAGR